MPWLGVGARRRKYKELVSALPATTATATGTAYSPSGRMRRIITRPAHGLGSIPCLHDRARPADAHLKKIIYIKIWHFRVRSQIMHPLPGSSVSLCQYRHCKNSDTRRHLKERKAQLFRYIGVWDGSGRWKCFIKVAAAPRRPQALRSGARVMLFSTLLGSFAVVLRNLLLNRLRSLAGA